MLSNFRRSIPRTCSAKLDSNQPEMSVERIETHNKSLTNTRKVRLNHTLAQWNAHCRIHTNEARDNGNDWFYLEHYYNSNRQLVNGHQNHTAAEIGRILSWTNAHNAIEFLTDNMPKMSISWANVEYLKTFRRICKNFPSNIWKLYLGRVNEMISSSHVNIESYYFSVFDVNFQQSPFLVRKTLNLYFFRQPDSAGKVSIDRRYTPSI